MNGLRNAPLLAALAAIVLLACVPGCSGGDTPKPTQPVPLVAASLTLAPTDTLLSVEDSVAVRVEARTASGQLIPNPEVTYSSFVPSVATVSQAGVLSANGVGLTSITATVGGVSATSAVRVRTKVVVYDIPALRQYAEVYGVSDAGEVVGALYGRGIPEPFVTTAQGITLLPVTSTDAPGQARAINTQSIVGYSDLRYNRWSRGRALLDSATYGTSLSIGIGVNAAGDVLLEVDQTRGMLRRASGQVDTIVGLRGPGSYLLPTSLASDGAVSGQSFNTAGQLLAIRWTKQLGTSVMSGLPVGAYPASIASEDRIVGYNDGSTTTPKAFLWTSQAGMRLLGTLGGPASVARGINDAGLVVGGAQKADGYFSAFTWRSFEGMLDIGATLSGASIAYAVSPNGQIAGLVYPASAPPPGLLIGPNKVVLWITRRRT